MTGIPPSVTRFMDSAQEKTRDASSWTKENVGPLVDGNKNGGALDGITGKIRGWVGAEKGSGGIMDKILGFAEDHPNLGSGAAVGAGIGLFSLLSGDGIMGSAGKALKFGALATLLGPALLALGKGLMSAIFPKDNEATTAEKRLPPLRSDDYYGAPNYVVVSPQAPMVMGSRPGAPVYGY